MKHMKYFIGGLFKNRGNAERARNALRTSDLDSGSINILQCTHEKEAVILDKNPSIQSIAVGALIGAILLGSIGAILGLLVRLNVIHIPSLDPSAAQALPFQITWQYILTSIATGLIFGGTTGAILGTATRLAMPKYRQVDTSQQASKGDLMLAVQADDTARVNKVKSTMKQNGAVSFEEFEDQWDPDVWSVFTEESSQVR
jgi:hypothetical protein